MESDLLNQGFELVLVGMGVVFVFLTTLVGVTAAMSRIVMRFQPGNVSADNYEEIAAISAAIARHRGRRKN